MSKRQTIEIQHTEGLSKDEIDNARIGYVRNGWKNVSYKMRPDLAGSGWKAYEWTGIAPAKRWVEDVIVGSYDPDESEILEVLADRGIKATKVLDFTTPVNLEDDAYVLHSVEVAL